MKIFYCTNEPNNPVDLEEVRRLKDAGNVVLVIGAGVDVSPNEAISAGDISPRTRRLIHFWLRICTLFSQIPNNPIGVRFPELNIYSQSRLLKKFVAVLWRVKLNPLINQILPKYSTLALLPFRCATLFTKRDGNNGNVVIYNSLFINVIDFMFFLARMRKSGARMIANVRSWDNPYYIQFDSAADSYLTWSQHMDQTIEKSQRLKHKPFIHWGPNQFRKFWQYGPTDVPRHNINTGTLNVGYAAAFGDPLVTFAEYEYICDLAADLRSKGVNLRILYRPYPTVDPELLVNKRREEAVVVSGIESDVIDRFGDGREVIRFGSPREKKVYLDSCDLFLSIGTTFTVEAFLHGTPIVHFYPPENNRKGVDANLFFKRIEITCVHFSEYFPGALSFVESNEELRLALLSGQAGSVARDALLERLGIDELSKVVTLKLLLQAENHAKSGVQI